MQYIILTTGWPNFTLLNQPGKFSYLEYDWTCPQDCIIKIYFFVCDKDFGLELICDLKYQLDAILLEQIL